MRSGRVLFALLVVVFAVGFVLYGNNTLRSSDRKDVTEDVVIVVGGGAAGMSAALEVLRSGSSVYLFDKESKLGGNSAKASSGINAVGTNAQKENNIPDTIPIFENDVMKSGQGLANEKLVNHLVEHSAAAVAFLEDLGVNLEILSQCGGHQYPRTHRSKPDPNAKFQKNIGSLITSTLEKNLRENSNAKIFLSSPVTKLLQRSDGSIRGVQVNGSLEFDASSVILASGGYGRDTRLLEEFKSEYKNLPSTNGNWTTGDGVHLAREISASIVGMEHVQVHPTGIIDPNAPYLLNKFLAAEAIRAGGAILINQKGKRFVNELGLRDQVTEAIFNSCEELTGSGGQVHAFMVLNEEVIESFGRKIMSFYQHKGFLRKFANGKEMAEGLGIPYSNLELTVAVYNRARNTFVEDEFGKNRFPCGFDLNSDIYTFLVTPSIHYTMGGVEIDENSRVLSGNGNPIPGLLAAGEVTGGVHGKNRLAGNSLLECVVFARSAAQTLAEQK